ncbi:hypothetical protein ACP70R_023456 [Stipagrostis hirtigluma subsp. patula]
MAEEASLAHTPTWVVAAVCLAIVSVSLATERFLHFLGTALKYREQKTLSSSLRRLKEELMLLGFISLLLSLSQGFIIHICVPETATRLMLPCKKENDRAAEEGARHCKQKGDVPLLSLESLHQLHIFIFVLGLVHVVFCASTILLGGAKMKKWKQWETEIHREINQKCGVFTSSHMRADSSTSHLYTAEFHHPELIQVQQADLDTPSNVLQFNTLQHKLVLEHARGYWRKKAVVSWIIAFLNQFDSVSNLDYKALRSAFVLIHYPKRPADFDFHEYIIRVLEYDFERVAHIRWYMWLFVIFFLVLNINGWHTYFWLAFLPLFLLLIVGAKLEHIITQLAQEAAASVSEETDEAPKIKPSKEHFWFHNPELVRHLIHFILFQNSFEIGFFFWVLVSYGFGSCMMERKEYAISRLVIGVIIQVVCSYITLPLYAIVTQVLEGHLEAFGLDVLESVQMWRRDNPADGDPNPDTEVEVTRAPNERFGSGSERTAMLTAAPPPDLDEIVTVNEDGSGRR